MAASRERVNVRDRILVVESDPTISDLIARQALEGAGYQVQIANDATTAIARALQWAPDLIMIDLNLPGLSGKDLMVALASQGVQTPLIIIASRGMEANIIQTFRLGASDYLLLPVREAEVVNAANRVLKQVHDRRERDRLAQQLQQANQELQMRVRELSTIFSLGKAMTSITEQGILLEKILESALRTTQADIGWFLLREDVDKPFFVAAEHNLPAGLAVHPGSQWDDGISSLVAMSGESLSIHGEPLRRFKISSFCKAAQIAPIKAQKKVIALLVMARKQPTPFGSTEQHLLEALADYAAISLVNARLFRTLEERARAYQQMAEAAQTGEKVNSDILRAVKKELSSPASAALASLDQLARDPTARWRADQRQQLAALQNNLIQFQQIAEAISPQQLLKQSQERSFANLAEILAAAVQKLQPAARHCGLSFLVEAPGEPGFVRMESGVAAQIVGAVLVHALRLSGPGGQIVVRLEKQPNGQAKLALRIPGWSPAAAPLEKMLDEADTTGSTRFGGLGIRLSLARELILKHSGTINLDPQTGKWTDLSILLPLAR